MKKLSLAVFFAIPFCVYLYTLHPTVAPYRDSGDLIVAASTLGIAHPPGYPLYVLTGKIFLSLLKLGNEGYVMNVMSAFFAAAALFCAALTILELTGSTFACAAVFFLAFSPACWRLAQISEMYSLNAFLAAVVIYLAAKAFHGSGSSGKPGGAGAVYFLSLICGLACANHPTIAFVFPGLLWFVYRSARLSPKDYFYSALFFAAGISADFFILARAWAHPELDWGKPETLGAFLRAVTRADYGGLKLHPEQSKFSWTAGIIWGHLLVYLRSLVEQFTISGALLGAWGIYLERKGRFYKFLLISLVVSGPFFIILSNLPPAEKTTLPILEPHLVLPGLIFAFFIAASIKKLAGYGLPWRAAVLAAIAVLFAVKLPLCSYRQHFYAYDYGVNLLKTAPLGSVIYDPDDTTAFVLSYLQAVRNKRTDIKLAEYFRTRWGYELLKERHPDILPEREIASGQELARVLLDFNRPKRGVFAELPGKFPQGYESYPVGLLYKLSRDGEFLPSDTSFEVYSFREPCLTKGNYDFFTAQVISYYASARNNLGLSFARQNKFGEAKDAYYSALSIDPALPAVFNNMGSLEFSQKNYTEAEKWFLELLRLGPESGSALYNTGVTFRAMKETEPAKKYIGLAWRKYFYPDAGNELGLMALESGNPAEAEALLKSVAQMYPGYLLAYYNLGLSEKALGNFEESRKYFQVYADNTPDPEDKKETRRMIDSLPQNSRAVIVK